MCSIKSASLLQSMETLSLQWPDTCSSAPRVSAGRPQGTSPSARGRPPGAWPGGADTAGSSSRPAAEGTGGAGPGRETPPLRRGARPPLPRPSGRTHVPSAALAALQPAACVPSATRVPPVSPSSDAHVPSATQRTLRDTRDTRLPSVTPSMSPQWNPEHVPPVCPSVTLISPQWQAGHLGAVQRPS